MLVSLQTSIPQPSSNIVQNMKNERRAAARYRAKLPVEIEVNGYTIEEAVSSEVSLAGIRIDCEGPSAARILNRYIQVTPGENIAAKVNIKVPKNTGSAKKIHCCTRVVSVSRASQVRYVVGLEFIEFKEGSQKDWIVYISGHVNKV